MHRIEVHHFASPFAPNLLMGENNGFIQGDPAEIVGLPTEREGFPVRKRGAKAHKMVTTIWCMFDSP